MGRLSTRSNPTRLREIDKGRIGIMISFVEGRRYFNLSKLDLSGLNLSSSDHVFCVARAGKTSQRFDMGPLSSWRKDSLPLDDLDAAELLRFRILIHAHDNPQLSASAENLRPLDESQSESLLPMEPADLGQLLWRLEINEDGPVLKFNSLVFPSGAGVENYLPFAALVLPEAVRKVMERIAEQPEVLSDESDALSPWSAWLNSLGLDRPLAEFENDEKREWCDRVIDVFCNRHLFAARLGNALTIGGNDHD